jgi:hypothetical protein
MRTYFGLGIAAGALALFACSSSSNTDAAPGASTGGPPIAADQVGAACSGVGTSPGDTALFAHDDCPAGFCVADARTGLDTYCTADCDGKTCPEGYTCETVTFGDAKKACLTDGSAKAKPDAGGDSGTKTQSGTIGTKNDKGVKSIDVSLGSKSSWSCASECTKAGGKCNDDGVGNGVGYEDRKYNDGTGSTGGQISMCSETIDYYSFNTTLTSMVCYCDGMTVPPVVKVKKSEGIYTCDKVCTSWKMKCSASRKSYAYADPSDEEQTTITCSATPPATTNHYVCACDL